MSDFDCNRFVRRLVARRWLAQDVTLLESCRSTNEEARRRLECSEGLDSALFIAWEQNGGRGRRQRDWWSGPAGNNLAVTLCYRDTQIRPELFGLIGAVALADVLALYVRDMECVSLKWPNDILLHHAKVAGFLCEQPAVGNGTLLLGLGCNLAAAPPTNLAPYATCALADHLPSGSSAPSIEDFLTQWLWSFESGVRRFVLAGPESFENSYLSLLRRWAPHGVVDPRDGRGGPLLEFSTSRGLRWGAESTAEFRPLGWIPTLEPLQP